MELLPLGAHSPQFTSLFLSLFKSIGIDGEAARVLLTTLSKIIKSNNTSITDQKGGFVPPCFHELEEMRRVINEMISLQNNLEKIILCQRTCRRHISLKWAHAVSTKYFLIFFLITSVISLPSTDVAKGWWRRMALLNEWRLSESQYLEKLQYLISHYIIDVNKGISRKDEKAHNVKVNFPIKETDGELGMYFALNLSREGMG